MNDYNIDPECDEIEELSDDFELNRDTDEYDSISYDD